MSEYNHLRWAATLTVPLEDSPEADTAELPVNVVSATWTQNDHNQADELELELDWQNIGLDPRSVKDATVQFHFGATDDSLAWEANRDNLRFIGVVGNPQSVAGEDDLFAMRIKALDYTDFFLRARPFGTSGIPSYNQTLDEAFRTIVSQTPGAQRLADRLVLRGLSEFPHLGTAVSKRFRKMGAQVHVRPNTDAWAVWQQTVGMMGLVSFVDLDQIVVTTSDGYYRKEDPPKLVWGEAVSQMRNERNSRGFGTGVGVSSFDQISQRTIEAVFPPRSDPRLGRKRIGAKQVDASPEAKVVERYDWFTFPGVTSQDALQEIAKRAYLERSKQEFRGSVTTSNLNTTTDGGEPFQLLDLNVGDNIRIVQTASALGPLLQLETRAQRVEFLVSQGYIRAAAEIHAAAAEKVENLDSRHHVRGVRVAVDSSTETFELTVEYCNRILISGDSGVDDEAA